MHDGPLVDWPSSREAPSDIRRRLREIRPNAELLYQGRGVWMLGEVRWNSERYRKGVQIVDEFWKNVREHSVTVVDDPKQIAFLREGQLMMQGFVWIADYFGSPSGRIVEDYRRKCWKEDHGKLETEYYQAVDQSDMQTSLLRRVKVLTDRIVSEGKSDFDIIMRKRRSFTQRAALAANRLRAAALPLPAKGSV